MCAPILMKHWQEKVDLYACMDTWTDGRTDAGYFIVPLSGFFKTGGGQLTEHHVIQITELFMCFV